VEPSAEDLFLEAEKLENQEKYREAIAILDKAIEKDPEFLGAYINRGADYSAMGNYEKAIENYKIVLEKDRINQLAQFNIGNNYARLNKYREAIKYYNNILTDINGNPMPELIITDNDGNIGEFQVRFYEIAYERGLAYYELKSWDSAFVDFQFCINNKYMIPESKYMCGAIYEIYGMNEKACEEYSIAANTGDQDAKNGMKRVCQ